MSDFFVRISKCGERINLATCDALVRRKVLSQIAYPVQEACDKGTLMPVDVTADTQEWRAATLNADACNEWVLVFELAHGYSSEPVEAWLERQTLNFIRTTP